MIATTHNRESRRGSERRHRQPSRLLAGVIAVIGYLLSPLSWWNDLFINVPLAWLFAVPFSLVNEQLYLPSFVLGYWLSNVLGLLMLQQGGTQLTKKRRARFSWKGLALSASLYTILIVVLVKSGILPSAKEVIEQFELLG